MAAIKPIRTEGDLEQALERIDRIFDAEEGTPESNELDVLTDLVELYEDRRDPIGFPTPVAAIEFRMEQAGLTNRDLIPFIGSRSKVSEVLSGKRAITMSMARASPPAPRHTRRGAHSGARCAIRPRVRRSGT